MSNAFLRSLALAGERNLNCVVTAAAGLMLAAAATAGMYQVFSRFVLHLPATWSEPLVRICLVWMVYLGLMAAARSGSLIAVNFLYDMTRGPMREVFRIAIAASALALLAFLIWYGWFTVYMVRNQTIAGLGISASWAYSAIPVGCSFAAVAVIVHFFHPAEAGEPGR